MAVQLPDELIVDILSFLPAKSLLRFRLVCKSWLNLINSTKFKLMHLHNFNQLSPRYFARRLDYYESELYDVHFDNEAFELDWGTQIEFPFDHIRLNYCFRIVGCCNGVVCLSDDNNIDNEDDFSLDVIILWNPSIRRKLTLPLPMFYSVGFQEPFVVLGFGYDKISDDYKVVSLTYDQDSSTTRPKVEVYTVKTGIWREVMFPDNLRCYHTNFTWSPIFSNGCVHWITSDPIAGVSHYSIMTFDLTSDLFGAIKLPEFSADGSLRLSVVGESLAVIHSSGFNFDGVKSGGSTYMVMVMKEYKNPASWTMLYRKHYPDLDLGKPLRLRDNGSMVMELQNKDMIMFNHDEGYYVYVLRDGEDEDEDKEEEEDYKTYVDRYQESLDLLDVGDSVPNKEAVEALMKLEKQGHGIDNVAQHE